MTCENAEVFGDVWVKYFFLHVIFDARSDWVTGLSVIFGPVLRLEEGDVLPWERAHLRDDRTVAKMGAPGFSRRVCPSSR